MFVARSSRQLRRVMSHLSTARLTAMRHFSQNANGAKPYGAKPGYIKFKPIPDPLPGVNRPVFWGSEILYHGAIGTVAGFIIGALYWLWKEALVRKWVSNMQGFIYDYQKTRVETARDALSRERETPWWEKMSVDNANDFEEMKRFILAAAASTDDERYQILNLPKPWDEAAENKARDRVMNFSEYPNYFLPEMPNLPEGEDDDDDDDDDDE